MSPPGRVAFGGPRNFLDRFGGLRNFLDPFGGLRNFSDPFRGSWNELKIRPSPWGTSINDRSLTTWKNWVMTSKLLYPKWTYNASTTLSMEYTFFFIRNWSVRNWGYRGQNFKKLEGYITPTLRNWSVANSRNWILGVHKIHNFRVNPSPKVKKWFLFW